ncbi:protein TASOR [Rhinichthys klamathensis goyatoka]|uniref:protein TASOR n=1 Tax=Rhinichthys klamathensis goyatoka TaxID=3034132 RepID=UPI0024B49F51|nr:protein TASOR [Rhinichthys klamathensis goyatoka]
MEHRGGKTSDKEKHDPAAPSWSQNGGPEEECGCPDGPDEEKRLKRVSRAAKPAEEQPRLNFHIPRKSREKRALFQHVSLDSREFSEIQQILSSSYKDSSSAGTFLYSKPRLVHSDPLEKDFMEKRRELKLDGRTEKELSESFCFLMCDAQKVSVVCERGLSVGSSWMNMLGNPAKGVYLCQFSDLLQISPIEPGSTGNIVIFKVIKGKVKSVHDCMSRCIDPTPKFDSHFSKNSTRVTSLLAYRSFEYTQQYFYEYVDFEISSRPRHVCPYAVVSYYFKSRETSTAVPKPLAPLRTSSQPSGTSRGRRSYTVWRGHFVNQGKDMYQACLRSLSRPFLPFKLPEKIEVGTVMRLQQVKQKMPSALFSWSIYTGSHEVCKSGMFCSLFDVVEKDKSPKSLSALLQTLEEQGLVLVNMVKDRGFFFLLSASQMANSSERRGGWKMSCIQALFIYREKRELLKSPAAPCRPVSSERWGPVMPQHDSFVSALHLALSKARADPPADPSACVQQSVCEYLTHLRLGKPVQRVRTDYDPKLDVREKLFPAPRQKPSLEPFLRPYIYSPGLFTLALHGLKATVEELGHAGSAQENPERVQELLELIQLNKKSSQGGAGAEAAEKRKGELHAAEGAAKRQRSKPSDELAEADELQSAPHLSDVVSSVGLQDTDLRKDKSQSALKVMQMLDSFGTTSLDTDLRKDKSHGALEVIKLIDTLTRGSSESPADSELKEAEDISDAALFDSMLRLGLPTDRDIDLRKRFIHDDEPGRTDGLEEETAGSLSSLEAFSPCSDSGGQQRGVNLLGEKTIPWVLIPITGLKTERYSQRQMDHPEDPRFLQSPVVSTHTTPDKKELSPAYQPDSSNTAGDLEDPADAAEDDEPVPAAASTESHAPADPPPAPGSRAGVDLIVDEQISGFSSEVEQLLRNRHIYYVSCLSAQGSRGPPKTPVLPLSDYISNFHTPFPVTNYISSFRDSLKVFIDSQSASGARSAQEHVSSSTSATEVTSNVPDTSSSINPCASSPSTTTFESSLRPCSPSSALPDSMTPHHSSDVHEPPQTLWPLEQDSESQTREANSTSALPQGSAEMNGGPVAETTETVEGQMAHTHAEDVPMAHTHTEDVLMEYTHADDVPMAHTLTEDVPMEHAHSHTHPEEVPMERAHTRAEDVPMERALSSIIHQLQPEVISNLVEILKGVQKNSVHFYIHSTNEEEESDVCWEIKEYLKKLGDLECNPQGFLEKSNSQDKLLVIIPNMDIATQVHKIPSLVSLKKHPSVSFAGVDNLSDIQNHTYNELFQSGGFIVSDEHVLNPAVITAEKLRDILEHIERLNSPQSPWRWRIHFKSHKKLREHSRLKGDALNLYEILAAYEKRHIVEILSYHECDAPSRRAPDLGCLVDLQARFIKQRHLIFLTGFQFEMFPLYSSSGIVIANVDDVKFVISSLASGEAVASVPSAETYPCPDPASLRDDSMSMDSDQDSSDNSVSVTAQLSHVVTDQQPSLATDPFPPVSEPALHQHPANTETSDTPKELDFKALSEAISQFKASRMLAKCDAGDALETSFRVDPHQSFLGLGDLCESPQFSSDTPGPPAAPPSRTEPAAPTPLAAAPSRVEASGDVDHRGGSLCVLRPAAPIPENDNQEPWAQTSPIPVIDTRSGMTGRKAEGGQASNGSSVLGTPPRISTGSFDQCGFLPTPRYGMGSFYPGLQGSGFMSATHRAMGLSGPGFASYSGAVGLGHPLLNCTVSNGLGAVGPPAWRGFLPNNSVPMAWHSLPHGSSSPARFGSDVQRIQSAPFLQNWQRDAHRPDGGGFGGW